MYTFEVNYSYQVQPLSYNIIQIVTQNQKQSHESEERHEEKNVKQTEGRKEKKNHMFSCHVCDGRYY